MVENFQKCKSRDHTLKTTGALSDDSYVPIVGNSCYRYSRKIKEDFFKDFACAYLFYKAKTHLKE
jgi:hypothetical protein